MGMTGTTGRRDDGDYYDNDDDIRRRAGGATAAAVGAYTPGGRRTSMGEMMAADFGVAPFDPG